MAVYWVIAHRLNRRVADGVDPGEDQADEDLMDAFADKTDFQQKTFKYTT
jgi:hypothetical protein